MKRLVVWMKRLAVAVGVIVMLVATAVYAGSESVRRRTYDVPVSTPGAIPADQAAIARGDHLAHITGCFGCHGTHLEGRLFFSERGVADLVAPNLTRVVPTYSDTELARAIRHGVRRDGTGLFAMPSEAFYHFSDADLRDVVALLRHQAPVDGYTGHTSIGPIGRIGIVTGKFKPVPSAMDHAAPRVPDARDGDLRARGHYLAQIACSECHGSALQGGLDGRAPTLAIVGAYSDEAFRHLMRTGEPLVKRPLYLMGDVARGRFSKFTDDEVTALQAYLRTIAPAVPQ